MIARHETHMDKMDIWSKLSAALPPGAASGTRYAEAQLKAVYL